MSRAEQVRYYALSLVLPLALMGAVTYGMGLLVVGVPQPGDVALSKGLASIRTPPWNTLTDYGTSLSDTPYVVAFTAVAAIVFRLVLKRWLESVFLIAAVWGQSLVFLATTEPVGRSRPPVPHLDPAPPTSSFPSGHVSAAVAFYCGMALVLSTHVRGRAPRVAIWAVGVAAPLIVAFSRLYRGMHFFTDVTWGLLLGVFCVVVAARSILRRSPDHP
ncbi:phosphoesterase PA-phosphatase [Nonomuraea sp. WAC 01424]|uniref:phosphatase PAP2 family protein n=1 Tax=Nonomuraea sp. WAC 01424 TaxID=2203200 RepID=UPI000F7A06F8|nr:phosphatase PAP2 family protein [Nonomuraea sp. WAC 01424]RSN09416.1 phosphoesterase PA-phosphatase [Nonomuraea sp. WAC 01424]